MWRMKISSYSAKFAGDGTGLMSSRLPKKWWALAGKLLKSLVLGGAAARGQGGADGDRFQVGFEGGQILD